MYLGAVTPLTTAHLAFSSAALLASYTSSLFSRGEALAERLVKAGISPSEIAFDADGVLQFYAVGNQQGEQGFYETFYDGGVSTGSAIQFFMEVPGLADLILGLNHPTGSPLMVTSMSVTRAVAMFNGFPRLRKAFFGDCHGGLVTPTILRESPRIYCAEHLASGIRTLFDISEGLPDSLGPYPGEWHDEIQKTVPALTDPWYRGRLIKNPAVIALARSVRHFPRILVDDTRNNIQAAIDYSLRMAVVRPLSPWGPRTCFFDDPHAMLVRHWDRQAEAIADALEALVESMIQEGGHTQVRLVDISRESIGQFDGEPAPEIVTYVEEATVLDREYYQHVRDLVRFIEERHPQRG